MSHTYPIYVCRHTLSLSSHPFQITLFHLPGPRLFNSPLFSTKADAKIQPFSKPPKYFFTFFTARNAKRLTLSDIKSKIFFKNRPSPASRRRKTAPRRLPDGKNHVPETPFRGRQGYLAAYQHIKRNPEPVSATPSPPPTSPLPAPPLRSTHVGLISDLYRT